MMTKNKAMGAISESIINIAPDQPVWLTAPLHGMILHALQVASLIFNL